MAQNSKISWTTHSFNHVRGCTKISPGCTNCYAEQGSKRNPAVLGIWGPQGTREIASDAAWREPIKWNRWAIDGTCYECGGRGQIPNRITRDMAPCKLCDGTGNIGTYRARIFCASLADAFEGRDTMPPTAWDTVHMAQARLFNLIHVTRQCDWLLLTKRPENARNMLERFSVWTDRLPTNIWLGASVEDQQRAEERIPHLLGVPAQTRFLSVEPLLGPLDLSPWLRPQMVLPGGLMSKKCGIDWVIVGGESGHRARSMEMEWVEEIVGQCAAAGVACFVKQFGSRPVAGGQLIQVGGKKGEILEDWPEHLQVREFPK